MKWKAISHVELVVPTESGGKKVVGKMPVTIEYEAISYQLPGLEDMSVVQAKVVGGDLNAWLQPVPSNALAEAGAGKGHSLADDWFHKSPPNELQLHTWQGKVVTVQLSDGDMATWFGGSDNSGESHMAAVEELIPGLAERWAGSECPVTPTSEDCRMMRVEWREKNGYEGEKKRVPFSHLAVHLNDAHGWERAKIVDWLEGAGADLTVKVGEEDGA